MIGTLCPYRLGNRNKHLVSPVRKLNRAHSTHSFFHLISYLTLVEWQGCCARHRVHFRRLGKRHLPYLLDVLHHPVSHQQEPREVLLGGLILRWPVCGLQAAKHVQLLELELQMTKGGGAEV